jgi:putative ABC transport system permease protein
MSVLSDIAERVRALVFRRRDELELREELDFHITMDAAQRQRRDGVDSVEARRRSILALGGVEPTREAVRDARGTRGVTDLLGDLRYAARMLRERPGFTAVALLTIAVGISGTTAVFSTFDTVILRALPYRDPGQLVRLYKSTDVDPTGRSVVTPVHFVQYRQRLSRLQSIAALNLYDRTGADIGAGDDVRRIRTLQVSADYFDVLRAHPLIGRAFGRDEEHGLDDDGAPAAPLVILSDRLWQERFQRHRDAVGSLLEMNGRPYTIVGVMPPRFADPLVGGDVDAWVPLNLTPGQDLQNASNHYLSVIGRLAPGVTIAQAQSELDAVGLALLRDLQGRATHTRARLYPLKDDVVGGARRSLQLILGAVALVLLLVCVNIANLLLVRGSEREREFAMRSALGARRGRLVRQLLAESVLLAAVGAVLALPLARLLMSAIVRLGGTSIPRLDALHLDRSVLAFCAGAALASALLFGLAPAWRAAQTQPADVLRGNSRSATGDRRQGRVRSALVVAQVALAFVLLVGAGLLLASFRKLHDVPLGVRPDHVLAFQVHLPDVRYDSLGRAAFYRRLDHAIDALPGVRGAGAISKLPATGSYHDWGVAALTGPLVGSDQGQTGAEQRIVTPGYFTALGVPAIAGRLFDDRDGAAEPDRVVIGKRLADALFPHVPAVGQRLRAGGHSSDVIGVVPDVAIDAEGDMPNMVYHAHDQFSGDRNWALFEVVATSQAPAALEPAVRRVLAEIDPQLVMDHPDALTDLIGEGTAQRAFTLKVLLVFSLTALFLAALGIFGVLSYTVRLRDQEFGLRMALGATPATILRNVLRQALGIAAVGVVAGLAGTFAASHLMASMLFQMSALDPRVLAGVAVIMLAMGALAAYFPARRAIGADPRRVMG